MRLSSTKFAIWLLPPSIVGYGWVYGKKVHVVCVMLHRLLKICVSHLGRSKYSNYFSLPGYLKLSWLGASLDVDTNTGRSSTTIARNCSFRGIGGFVTAEFAVPLQVRLVEITCHFHLRS